MDVVVFHRNREDRHNSHHAIDCLASAPSSVKRKSRRSVRAAGKVVTRALYFEALDELAEMRSEGLLPA